MICWPEDSYGIAKLAVEWELAISYKMFGLPYVIFRPHNVYGRRQNIGDRYRNVVGIFMNQVLQGKPMTIFGDGSQARAFTHVTDVAPIIANSVNKLPTVAVYNVGSEEYATVLRLSQLVAEAMEVEWSVEHLPERNEIRFVYADHSQIKRFTKRAPTPLWAGLQDMAWWVKEHGARQGKRFENIEITKNLPPSWK